MDDPEEVVKPASHMHNLIRLRSSFTRTERASSTVALFMCVKANIVRELRFNVYQLPYDTPGIDGVLISPGPLEMRTPSTWWSRKNFRGVS